jgi:hypothetical protein
LRLQRLRERFRWLQLLLRSPHWRPLWLLQLWSLLWLPLPGLRLVWSPLLSVELALLVCPRPVPLLSIHFARHWLQRLPLLPLQQPLLLPLPDRTLYRQLSFRCSLLLWSRRWLRLLLQLPQWLRLRRWLARFRWLQWLLR